MGGFVPTPEVWQNGEHAGRGYVVLFELQCKKC
jgi:hypothetical protein